MVFFVFVFLGFVEWFKFKVLGILFFLRRLEFYYLDFLLFIMKKKMNVKIKCLLINIEKIFFLYLSCFVFR